MKFKRLVILTLAFIMMGTVTVLASDAFQWYKGKDVKVVVNDKELNSPGILMSGNTALDNTTMLPVRELAGTLQALVNWDSKTQTVNIYKPNVNILLSQSRSDGSYTLFGGVKHRSKYIFNILAQIDSLTTKVHAYKITISDPNDNEVSTNEGLITEQKENQWIEIKDVSLQFKELGGYTVKVFLKINETDDFSLVSEMVFQSTRR